MLDDKSEKHLDVYEDRYELHQGEKTTIYYQGFQNEETQRRYAHINQTLAGDIWRGSSAPFPMLIFQN